MPHSDKIFLKRFSGIIMGLVIVTILIIIIATFMKKAPSPEDNPSRLAMAAERIAPVADYRTELPEPQAEPESAAEPPLTSAEVADAGTAAAAASGIDGGAVYAQVCQACHISGAAGAPIPGTDPWSERAAKGIDALTANAVNGIGMMPPKGGRMDMSDEQIRAAVEHMLTQ